MDIAPKSSTPVKITFPRLGHILARTRLFQLLDDARQRRIVWISAPPGAGKTTLAASYLIERKLKTLWYQMDEGDADIASFFYYMGIAAKKASPNRKSSLPLFTPEYTLGLPVFAKRYFEQLYSWMKPPFVLVFDNYQTVSTESPLHEILRNGLELMPDGGNAIIISREDPPPAFARMRANQSLALVDWEALQLDDAEYSEIIRLKDRQLPDSDELKRLQSRTGGWMAGLILLLETQKSGNKPDITYEQLLGKYSPQVVFDYFATEILEQQDAVTQEFLIQVSHLPRMTSGMAYELTGVQQSEQILCRLHQGHYFIERHIHDEILYQFHPLFHEFLHTRARQHYSPDEYTRLQHQAARVLEAAGQIEAAVVLFQEAGDWVETSRIICQQAMGILQQGRGETIAHWISRIPQTVIEDMPWLRFWLGVSLIGKAPIEARKPLEQAFLAFKQTGDLPGMFMALSKIIETFSYGWYDVLLLDKWIDELETLLAEFPRPPSPEIGAQVTVAMFVALMHRRPNHPDMERWTQQTRELCRAIPGANERVIIGMHLATYYVWWGRHRDMALLLDELRPLLEGDDISPMGFIIFHAIEAMYYTRSLAGDGAKTAQAALERAEQSGVYVINPLLLGFRAMSSMHANDLDTAATSLAQLATMFHPARMMDQGFYHWCSGHLAWLQGNISGACDHARECMTVATKSGSVFHEHMTPVTLAKILVEAHEYEEAAEIIDVTLSAIRQIDNPTLEYECLLVMAKSSFAQKDDEAALTSLRNALALMRYTGAESTIWWNPQWMVPLLSRALDNGIEVEFVQSLIRKHKLVPGMLDTGMEHWPWPVKIYAFGGLTLLLNDEPVQWRGKSQKKPLELLKALLAFGGRNIGENQITDVLWPDAEGDDARHSLKTTVHRLRKLLGGEQTIKVEGGKLSLNPYYVWADVWEFERLLEHRHEAASVKHEGAGWLERAVDLYHGSFLNAEAEDSWVLATRERLRSRYLRAVEEIGAGSEKSDHWEQAIECYERGIIADDLAEPFYQRLIVCHARQGRRGEAMAVYERYCKVLAARFGLEPSKEIQTVVRQLQT